MSSARIDLCDPDSDREHAVVAMWMILIGSILSLSILRMICSRNRVRNFKRNLGKRRNVSARSRKNTTMRLEFSIEPPELTHVLKNKRTHECFCEENNAFIRRNVRDSSVQYRNLKRDISLRKSVWNSVLGNKRVYLRALVWACISTGLSGFAQHSIKEYGDKSITQALDSVYEVAKDIVFLTMLLVADYVSAETRRWHSIQHAAWRVQGSLVDLARTIGSHIVNDPERKIAYRAHRYLTLAHVLLHRDANAQYKFDLEDLVHAGLVDRQDRSEGRALQLLSDHPENGVLGWIEGLLDYSMKGKHLPATTNFVIEVVALLRDQMQLFRNAQDDQPPASWSILVSGLQVVLQVSKCS
jgi:hypothetical protein